MPYTATVPELVVLLKVKDELSGLAEVVFFLGGVRAVGVHRTLHRLRHVGSRWLFCGQRATETKRAWCVCHKVPTDNTHVGEAGAGGVMSSRQNDVMSTKRSP